MTRIASIYGVCLQWCLHEARADLAIEGSLGNWAKFISFGIPSLSFVRSKLPQISHFYIRRPGITIFHIYESWNPVGVPSFSHFHEPKMPSELWVSQLRQRKQRPKIFQFFNRTRKRTLFLLPGTIASADHARFLMSLQNVNQECAGVG